MKNMPHLIGPDHIFVLKASDVICFVCQITLTKQSYCKLLIHKSRMNLIMACRIAVTVWYSMVRLCF